MRDHPIREVYSRDPLSPEGFSSSGQLSIDHFVPWSFVLHDEPWNLLPTFRDTNSSKGNQLPDLDAHLDAFCAQHLDALLTLRHDHRHRATVEGYLSIDPSVMSYERSGRSLDAFSRALRNVIVPLHQIARNQGFPLWPGLVA